jgi:ABC-2 type transport system permease protein
MLIPFLALMRKDFRLFFADPRAVLMSVVAPIVIASFFGYIFGGGAGNEDHSRIPVLVSDLDSSTLTREIVSRLAADPTLDVKPSDPDPAREAVRKGKATVAFVIPKNFTVDATRALLAGGPPPQVTMRFDPSHGLEMRMLEGMFSGAVMRSAGKSLFGGGREVPSPFQVQSEPVTSSRGISYNGYAHSFGGMGIQFMLMVGVEVGVGILLRRQHGVWKRMRAAPISRIVMLGSRVTSSGLTSMATLIILFGFARVVFGVRIQGSFAGFLAICAAFSLMTAAFGLLIAALGKTAEATRGIAILTTLLMVMLGGAWVPTFIFPKWLQSLTVVIPTRWAMDALDGVTWRGLGFSAVAPEIALLLAAALAFGAIAVARFRWEAD